MNSRENLIMHALDCGLSKEDAERYADNFLEGNLHESIQDEFELDDLAKEIAAGE